MMLVCEGADSGWVCARAQLGAEGAGVHHVLVWSTPLGRTRWLVAVFAGVGCTSSLSGEKMTGQPLSQHKRVIAGPKEHSSKYDSLRFGDYHYALKKGGLLWYRSGRIRIFIILAEPSGDKPRPRGSRMRDRDRALKRRWLESLCMFAWPKLRMMSMVGWSRSSVKMACLKDAWRALRGCPVVAAVAKAVNRSLS